MRLLDIERMVSLKGMIIRCSSIIPEIREAIFRCLVCGYYSDPIVINRGNWIGSFTLWFYSCNVRRFWVLFFSLLLCFLSTNGMFSGQITEPKLCLKEECQAKDSMTLVHNRCR